MLSWSWPNVRLFQQCSQPHAGTPNRAVEQECQMCATLEYSRERRVSKGSRYTRQCPGRGAGHKDHFGPVPASLVRNALVQSKCTVQGAARFDVAVDRAAAVAASTASWSPSCCQAAVRQISNAFSALSPHASEDENRAEERSRACGNQRRAASILKSGACDRSNIAVAARLVQVLRAISSQTRYWRHLTLARMPLLQR
jgi:hypothetical protein